MKTVAKSVPPNELTNFAVLYPLADWDDDFRNYAIPPNTAGHDYRQIKKRLIADQGGLCAYCEAPLVSLGAHLQKVEHFHPKSDKSVPGINWGLRWDNLFAVCTGGEHADLRLHPLPINLSCDSHKNHWIVKSKPAPAALLVMLASAQNPMALPAAPCPFDFEKSAGRISPNQNSCAIIDLHLGVPAGTTFATLKFTIDTVLNLNCDRLCTERLQVLTQLNQEVAKARQFNDRNYKVKLAAKWFGHKWPSFFTTRRILLGAVAESHLQSIGYQG